MHVGVTLTPEEFSKLHNALCHLSNAANAVERIGHADDAKVIADEVEVIRALLKPAYEADEKEFTKRMDHYREMGDDFDAQTSWSMYEVEHLNEKHPWPDAKNVVHGSHWGDHGTQVVPIKGDTYLDLYIAADQAICGSGDMHHCYIEYFKLDSDGNLLLGTGS